MKYRNIARFRYKRRRSRRINEYLGIVSRTSHRDIRELIFQSLLNRSSCWRFCGLKTWRWKISFRNEENRLDRREKSTNVSFISVSKNLISLRFKSVVYQSGWREVMREHADCSLFRAFYAKWKRLWCLCWLWENIFLRHTCSPRNDRFMYRWNREKLLIYFFFIRLPADSYSIGPICDAATSDGCHHTEMYSYLLHHGRYSFVHSLHPGSVYLRDSTNATSEISIAEAALQDLLAGSKSLRLVYRWNDAGDCRLDIVERRL